MKKPVCLLAGGEWRKPKTMLPLLTSILALAGKPQPQVAYVGTANGDQLMFYTFAAQLLKAAGAGSVVRVMLASASADVERAKDQLAQAEAVFISGGDVEEGMRWLQRHHLDRFLCHLHGRGKLFFGLSAGSIMLGTHWVRWRDAKDDATAELFDCLGIAPLVCDTHAEADDWEELKMAVKLLGPGKKGFGLPTNSGLKITAAGKRQAMAGEIVTYQNVRGRVERKKG